MVKLLDFVTTSHNLGFLGYESSTVISLEVYLSWLTSDQKKVFCGRTLWLLVCCLAKQRGAA